MNDDLSEQTQAVLSTMRKHAPWPAVLDAGGFKQLAQERWRTPGGDLVQIVTDKLGARLCLATPRDGDWLSNPRSCGAVFAHLHHQDDWQAAADDVVSAAVGSADATAAARSLPAEVLAEVARLASPAVAVPAEPPVGGRMGNVADTPDPKNDGAPGTRHSGLLRLTAAADITPMSQSWLWHPYIPLGALTLLAGREQVGKSTCSLALAADVTQGRLAGEYLSRPRSVVVVATEDSWETTIVPRLMAAGADLTRVFKLSAVSSFDKDQEGVVNLPDDLTDFEHLITDNDIAFVVLDPLMSRLSDKLDTHRDGSVRRGLEPLVGVAQRTEAALLGLIHVNKTDHHRPADDGDGLPCLQCRSPVHPLRGDRPRRPRRSVHAAGQEQPHQHSGPDDDLHHRVCCGGGTGEREPSRRCRAVGRAE